MKWQVSAANLSSCPWGKATGKESRSQLEQSGKEGELQKQPFLWYSCAPLDVCPEERGDLKLQGLKKWGEFWSFVIVT